MNRQSTTIVLWYLTYLMTAGCTMPSKPTLPELTPTDSAAATEALVEWFECEECEQGELEAVTKYGGAVVPLLAAVVVRGASPASLELTRRELEKRYDELAAYQKTHPEVKLASNKEEFVAMYLGNYNALYRTRAATALGIIGGDKAKEALEQALERVRRDDERRTIKSALDTLRSRPKN